MVCFDRNCKKFIQSKLGILRFLTKSTKPVALNYFEMAIKTSENNHKTFCNGLKTQDISHTKYIKIILQNKVKCSIFNLPETLDHCALLPSTLVTAANLFSLLLLTASTTSEVLPRLDY